MPEINLTGDDAKTWEQVRALNLPGEKIVERVQRADTLEAWQAATTAGLNPDALAPLAREFNLKFKVDTNVAHVRVGESGAWQKLTDAIKVAPLAPFAAALVAAGDASGRERSTQTTTSLSPADAVLTRNAARAARSNPLRSSAEGAK